MAVICEDIGLLYFCVPKTASTATTKFLVDNAGGEVLPRIGAPADSHVYWQYKHSCLRDLIAYGHVTRLQSGSLLKIATVRNPYDWVTSRYNFEQYMFKKAKSKEPEPWMRSYSADLDFAATNSFREYVYHHFAGKKRSVLGDIGMGVDRVIRFENLRHDLMQVLAEKGLSNDEDLPEINVSPNRERGHWKDVFDISMMNVIEECFQSDFDRFGYTYEDELTSKWEQAG